MATSLPRLHRATPFLVLAIITLVIINNTTAALQIPQRPTSFPLQRPLLAGEIVAWGSNNFSQINIPPQATNIVAISAGLNHSLALRNDGTVLAWGDNQYGQSTVPVGLADVVSLAAGSSHSLALKSNGTISAWGIADQRTIVPPTLTDAVAIAATANSSFALKRDGTVLQWGRVSGPVDTPGWTNIVAIRGAYRGCLGLRADGIPLLEDLTGAFPYVSDVARLGSTLTVDAPLIRTDGSVLGVPYVPVDVKAVAIASARYTYAAVKADSTVLVWGLDPRMLLTNIPPRLRSVIAIESGDLHFLALKLPAPPIPTTARASAEIVNGFVVALNVLDGGEGYAQPPNVTITGGGSGATATAQISRGVVTGFTITNAGIGYTSQPNITIEPPPFLPKLAIAPSRVNVTMQVVPGKRYQLESSADLPNFSPAGVPFIAQSSSVTNEFLLNETGKYFRIQEVP